MVEDRGAVARNVVDVTVAIVGLHVLSAMSWFVAWSIVIDVAAGCCCSCSRCCSQCCAAGSDTMSGGWAGGWAKEKTRLCTQIAQCNAAHANSRQRWRRYCGAPAFVPPGSATAAKEPDSNRLGSLLTSAVIRGELPGPSSPLSSNEERSPLGSSPRSRLVRAAWRQQEQRTTKNNN